MPKGPNGQKRPGDVIGAAIMVARLATGEETEITTVSTGRVKAGKAGGAARAKKLSEGERKQIAEKAANARWGNKD